MVVVWATSGRKHTINIGLTFSTMEFCCFHGRQMGVYVVGRVTTIYRHMAGVLTRQPNAIVIERRWIGDRGDRVDRRETGECHTCCLMLLIQRHRDHGANVPWTFNYFYWSLAMQPIDIWLSPIHGPWRTRKLQPDPRRTPCTAAWLQFYLPFKF